VAGATPEVDRARTILADESSDFISCENVRLELLSKAAYEKRRIEIAFYNEHFLVAKAIEPFSAELVRPRSPWQKNTGLAAGDALNLASAIRQGRMNS
jgi:hypothetical protein